MEVTISREQARGCGYRKPGKDGVGIYLMGGSYGEACERLPFPLSHCPCCGAGIKPARGFTWVNGATMFAGSPQCQPHDHTDHHHEVCMMCNPPKEPSGLLWVGGKFYKRTQDFMLEADRMGISRKVAHIPTGLVVGKTVIYLAHREAISHTEGEFPNIEITHQAGVFSAFIPTRVDLVI
ncbi:hypothetical protein PZC41_14520, partial [Staphylococcus aureus]|uniref:hypothetical protein n=1 Tax=Staphylococcus aureus TaxID=1280 RepID=UPI0023B1FFE1